MALQLLLVGCGWRVARVRIRVGRNHQGRDVDGGSNVRGSGASGKAPHTGEGVCRDHHDCGRMSREVGRDAVGDADWAGVDVGVDLDRVVRDAVCKLP